MSTSATIMVIGCIGPKVVRQILLKKEATSVNGLVHIDAVLRPRLRSFEGLEKSVLSVLEVRFHLDFFRLRDGLPSVERRTSWTCSRRALRGGLW